MGVNEAARHFGIPQPTLRRRIRRGDFNKHGLGPSCSLGYENEVKIKFHILKLKKAGFAPTRQTVREMAFRLADFMKIKHPFNKEKGVAGYDWLHSFLHRNSELSIRKSEGVSLARCQAMNKQEVRDYFALVEKTLLDKNILNSPAQIYNMDETGLQLNNKPGYVIAKKGSKNVAALTSSEKGETVTVLSCCNAEGAFLPPCLIFKGKNEKQEFEDGMPPGSKLYMNAKSAYVNTDIFLDWLKTHFVPRKPQGPVVLFLDGHSCHCNSVEMLEYAEANDITLLYFPSHTTQFLQPLERSFFKSLKSHYNSVCNTFGKTNPTKKINRLSFGKLFDDAWSKSATVENGKGGFKACGLYPFNPSAIPEYAFLTECAFSHSQEEHSALDKRVLPNHSLSPLPSTSAEEKNITPGTLLEQITPVPSTSSADQVRKRAKQWN
ncbi:uncharacterized protein [Leptinotarsa decemlineata]|uniref:uncharacterized protein n=1 Tax=Leptinotarsa decemlineata TaxID=7539 RepID=UPI003D3060BC